MKWTITKPDELEQIAQYVVKECLGGNKEKGEESEGDVPRPKAAAALGLYGDLGTGKTTFTQYLVRALGGKDTVVSPTFILERQYKVQYGSIHTIAHIDAYRFTEEDEAKVLQVTERLTDQGILFVIEWPELMGTYMPPHIKIQFTHNGGDTRTIEIL